MISIVVLTCNRVHLMRDCVEKVLARCSDRTTQIIIWDNASTDGTREYLQTLEDPRIQLVLHDENIGLNAYARAFAMTDQPYLIELDDDVIDAPQDWDATLVDAFDKIPKAGYLAANIIDDGKSVAADIMFRRDKHLYHEKTLGGVPVLEGPTGGWCTLTSRQIHDEVGGFGEDEKLIFWREDGQYVSRIRKLGYWAGILAELRVFHASGPAYSAHDVPAQAKAEFYRLRDIRRNRKNAFKRMLEAIPPIRLLNARLGLYQPPPPRATQTD